MRCSAWQQMMMAIAFFGATACSKVSVSKTSSATSGTESPGKTSTPGADKDEEPESENVIPPNNISGTYLICELTRDPNPALYQAVTTCAVRDEKTQEKIDLTAFRSHAWQVDMPAINSVSSMNREMPADSIWHLEVQIKAGSAVQLDQALQGTRVSVALRRGRGDTEIMSTPIMTSDNPQWLNLNGNRLPATAIPGGTEHMGRDILSICRMYVNGGVYPGKMQPHYENPQRSVCYSTRDGQGIQSMSDDGRTQIYKNDVMMPGARPWNEVLEWTTMIPGISIPKNAFVGGVDDRGDTLYVCRGAEAGPPLDPTDRLNDPTGEWTPGYVRAQAGFCQHEYYGQRNSVSYQILVWKTGVP